VVTVETRVFAQLVPCQLHERMLDAIQRRAGLSVHALEFLCHFLIEVFEQLPAGTAHLLLDLFVQLQPELLEACVNLGGCTAVLIDLANSPLDIEPGPDRALHLVTGPEYALEEIELVP
jgi:hypothetical protein